MHESICLRLQQGPSPQGTVGESAAQRLPKRLLHSVRIPVQSAAMKAPFYQAIRHTAEPVLFRQADPHFAVFHLAQRLIESALFREAATSDHYRGRAEQVR